MRASPSPMFASPGLPGGAASALLAAAAEQIRLGRAAYAAVLPEHWESPAALAYRRRIDALTSAADRLAGTLDGAAAAARVHENQSAAVRAALAGPAMTPR
ncbi:hypothetical protein EXU48_01750 [Occultella glacieicola]|uniref:Uncharacterized protein n=1 Tax=Occultella glacieicola TaxID=2518684 RepID=A0ABY2E8W7_9MICO|nr:hypothetical protein [Occultella glacieicola]TDE98944.1 hypothetical protein EXU48_01750 [Occultella glacieicola]